MWPPLAESMDILDLGDETRISGFSEFYLSGCTEAASCFKPGLTANNIPSSPLIKPFGFTRKMTQMTPVFW